MIPNFHGRVVIIYRHLGKPTNFITFTILQHEFSSCTKSALTYALRIMLISWDTL